MVFYFLVYRDTAQSASRRMEGHTVATHKVDRVHGVEKFNDLMHKPAMSVKKVHFRGWALSPVPDMSELADLDGCDGECDGSGGDGGGDDGERRSGRRHRRRASAQRDETLGETLARLKSGECLKDACTRDVEAKATAKAKATAHHGRRTSFTERCKSMAAAAAAVAAEGTSMGPAHGRRTSLTKTCRSMAAAAAAAAAAAVEGPAHIRRTSLTNTCKSAAAAAAAAAAAVDGEAEKTTSAVGPARVRRSSLTKACKLTSTAEVSDVETKKSIKSPVKNWIDKKKDKASASASSASSCSFGHSKSDSLHARLKVSPAALAFAPVGNCDDGDDDSKDDVNVNDNDDATENDRVVVDDDDDDDDGRLACSYVRMHGREEEWQNGGKVASPSSSSSSHSEGHSPRRAIMSTFKSLSSSLSLLSASSRDGDDGSNNSSSSSSDVKMFFVMKKRSSLHRAATVTSKIDFGDGGGGGGGGGGAPPLKSCMRIKTLQQSLMTLSKMEPLVGSVERYGSSHSRSYSSSASLAGKAGSNGGDCGDGTQQQQRRWNNKRVNFGNIEIRQYSRALGDNPACSDGPPISLGWKYGSKPTVVPVDVYETGREPRRTYDELRVPMKRRETLLRALGYSTRDLIEADLQKKMDQAMRERTVSLLKHKRWEETMEVARFIFHRR